jgi:hypothetical protein
MSQNRWSAADLLPRFLLRPAAEVASRLAGGNGSRQIAGLEREQWRALAHAFPGLGRDPAPRVLRARRRREFLIGRALASLHHDAVWTGSPEGGPTVFVTAHIGDVRALRYLMRRRMVIASVRGPWQDRAKFARFDAGFDQLWPCEFPHVFSSATPHALRTALRRGSLIVTADVPDRGGFDAPLLGGTIRLDPRPFRLARLARVPCRPAFLTAPHTRLTVTVGSPLPESQHAALEEFGRVFRRVAADAPFEIDGPTRWGQLR